jgi:WD40 repeat protein
VLTAHRVDATPGGYTGTVKSVAFSSDGALLATSGGNATVSLWSMPTLAHVRNIPARSATPDTPELTGIVETTFSPDGQTLATASGGTVHFWDIATAALSIGYRTLTNPTGSMTGVTFSPDGRTLATGSNDNAIRLWNPHSGELIIKRDGHTETVNSLAFSPAHAMLASASQDGTVRLWALAV